MRSDISLEIGALRGLQQCASATGRFTIVALDHRQSLRKMLRPSDPDGVSYTELVEFKRSAVRALAPAATGVLLDPELGAAQCVSDGSLPGHVGLVIALEATGYVGLPTARKSRILEGWSSEKARTIGASACKFLVYYHPDASNVKEQESVVSNAVEQCHSVGLPIFVEPLTHAITEGRPLEAEERRRMIVRTARTMTALGGDVLKLQFPYGPEETDRGRWQEACTEITEAAGGPWVLLSGDNSPDAFVELAEVACRAGASGIACGRGIWVEAATLSGAEREAFLARVALPRLQRLYEIVETHARPWMDAFPPVQHNFEGWYRS